MQRMQRMERIMQSPMMPRLYSPEAAFGLGLMIGLAVGTLFGSLLWWWTVL